MREPGQTRWRRWNSCPLERRGPAPAITTKTGKCHGRSDAPPTVPDGRHGSNVLPEFGCPELTG
jgi:hypothetical protein